MTERLQLEPVDDGQLGGDVDRMGRRRVEAEEPGAPSARGKDGLVGDLELAQDRVVLRQLDRRRASR